MKCSSLALIRAAVLSGLAGRAQAEQDLFFDFGVGPASLPLTQTKPSIGWNFFLANNTVTDVTNPAQINESVSNAVDSTNTPTAISVAFPNTTIVPATNTPSNQNYVFGPGNNQAGYTGTLTGPAAVFNINNPSDPADPTSSSVAFDNWFGSVNFQNYPNNGSGPICDFTDARFVLSGLSPTSTYSFVFFASRNGITDPLADDREGKYSVAGSNSGFGLLNASDNTSNVAAVSGISPDGNNDITVDVTKGPDNNNGSSFFYLGAMEVIINPAVVASSGTWALSTGGSWNAAGSWTGGIPNAQAAVANFLASPTGLTSGNAPGHVTLDANQTVGQIVFNNTSTYSIDPGSGTPSATLTIDDNGDAAGVNPLINVQSGNHLITASVSLAAGVTVSTAASTSLNISGSISGAGGLIKSNPGTLTLSAVNNYAGNTNVTGGTMALTVTGALPLNTGLTIASGATVALTNHGANPKVVLQTSSLNNSGTLDLSNNDLIAFNGAASLSTIVGQLKAGFNAGAGYWNGAAGIVSTAAAGDTRFLTTLGYKTGGSAFDGVNTTSNDVLVKYTYYGDADLSGTLDGSDYHQLDLGFNGHLTGWSNGDFNYDGVVNGADYALLDNTFNQVAATGAGPLSLVASPTAVSAVPEPTALTLLGVGAIGLATRSRRRNRTS